MTFVKICGITHREDAHAAIDAGADALGFIAVRESPRFISASDFRRIRQVLPDYFPLVVVVRRPSDAASYEAPIVQYYEESDLPDLLDPSTRRIKAYRVHDAEGIEAVKAAPDHLDAILLDAFHTALLGGSGARFDWSLTQALVRWREQTSMPLILAGGLKHENVARAIAEVRPDAVDVSSGVEEAKTPGKKRADLMRLFVAAVRDADEQQNFLRKNPLRMLSRFLPAKVLSE